MDRLAERIAHSIGRQNIPHESGDHLNDEPSIDSDDDRNNDRGYSEGRSYRCNAYDADGEESDHGDDDCGRAIQEGPQWAALPLSGVAFMDAQDFLVGGAADGGWQ